MKTTSYAPVNLIEKEVPMLVHQHRDDICATVIEVDSDTAFFNKVIDSLAEAIPSLVEEVPSRDSIKMEVYTLYTSMVEDEHVLKLSNLLVDTDLAIPLSQQAVELIASEKLRAFPTVISLQSVVQTGDKYSSLLAEFI